MVNSRESDGCKTKDGRSMVVVASARRPSSRSSFSRDRNSLSRVRRLACRASFRRIHRRPLEGGAKLLNFLRLVIFQSLGSSDFP
jgi:hypothetical protein